MSNHLDGTLHHTVVKRAEFPAPRNFGVVVLLTFPSTQSSLDLPAVEPAIRIRRTLFRNSASHVLPTSGSCHGAPPICDKVCKEL
jgi:hypothetical protein